MILNQYTFFMVDELIYNTNIKTDDRKETLFNSIYFELSTSLPYDQ